MSYKWTVKSMNEKKLSVIIPIYNAKEYLPRCLDSVIGQTYNGLEIILIDDGSTDGASEIADIYASKDDRIKLIHQDNQGESHARNVGLSMVTGDYFTFVDCDDWVDEDMYEELMDAAISKDADIAASSWYKDYGDKQEIIKNEKKVTEGIIDREQLALYVYERDAYRGFSYMWDKIYKKKLLYQKDGNIYLFPEDLRIGGDVLFLAYMVFNSEKTIYIDKPYYHYFQRNDSGCHSENLNNRMDWIEAYFRVLKYINDNNIQTQAIPWIERFLAYHSSNVAELAYQQKNEKVLEDCIKYMKRYAEIYRETNKDYPDRINGFNTILQYKI